MKATDVVVVASDAMASSAGDILRSLRGDASRIRIVVMAAPTHRRRLDGHKGGIVVHPDAWASMSHDIMAALAGWGLCGIRPRTTGRPMPIVTR